MPLPPPPPREQARGGLAAERLRRRAPARRAVRPEPAVPARLDLPGASPARVSARDRVRAPLLHEQLRRDVRRQHEDRQAGLEAPDRPLCRRLAGGGERHRLPVVHEPAAVQQQGGAGAARRRGDCVRRRLRGDPLADADRPDGVVAPRRRRRRLRGRLARPRLRARRDYRPRALDVPGRGADQGRGRPLRQPALRRHLRRLSLRAAGEDGQADLADEVAGPTRRPRAVLLDTGDRVRARLHRLDRRQGLLLRRRERDAPLVARDRRIRLRLSRRLAQDGLRRLLQRSLLRARRRHRATCAGASAPTATSPARRSS